MAAAVAKKKKGERLEMRVEAAWLDLVAAEAERWGLSVAGYIRLAVNEKMERDRQRPGQDRKDG
jgi:hypothetical protein